MKEREKVIEDGEMGESPSFKLDYYWPNIPMIHNHETINAEKE